ncbi:MAG: hypothetical protein MI863_20205 [Desulfobacterales bacterium]|nr:hypothetical protein [Desulfobacterales bacterium]
MSDQIVPRGRELTFNIIFTPGSFAYLKFLLPGMLNRLTCSFRLAANGCSREETAAMTDCCKRFDRLEFHQLPFTGMVPHGKALNHLQKMERTDYFCFMDPDIVVTHNFLSGLLPALAGQAAVFSGRPVWQETDSDILPEGENRLMGRYCRTAGGLLLGSSYFGIYRNPVLNRFIEKQGFCFERFSWPELPPRASLLLVKTGLAANYYDTAKVLNILLQEQGAGLCYHDTPGLLHIGGLSCNILSRGKLTRREDLSMERSLKRKLSVHLLQWLHALLNARPLPSMPAGNHPEIHKKIARLKRQITEDYHAYKDRF